MFSLCRLCAQYTTTTELVIDVIELESKLLLCCGWKRSDNEEQMPQKVCNLCMEKVEQSWTIAEGILKADERLKKLASELILETNVEPVPHAEEIIAESIKHELDVFSGIPEQLEYNLDIDIFNSSVVKSDTEKPPPNTNRIKKRKRKTTKVKKKHVEKIKINSDLNYRILAALSDEDRLDDGTISANAIARLEKLFPKMKEMTWNQCQFKCKKCNVECKSPQNFFAHNRSFHLEKMPTMEFFCFYCDSKHRREFTLNRHLTEHFPHLKFSCYYCTDYFWDMSMLAKHRNMHTDVEYKCEICQQIVYNRDILYSHIAQTHLKKKWFNPDEKFTCEICNKDFATKWSIKSHMLQHTKKYEFVCEQCGWKFHTKGNLKGHLETTHSNERPFSCTKCDRKFKTRYQVLKHSQRHEDYKPLECTICSKRFRQTHYLTVHMRSHNNINPYKCRYCERMFRHNSSLRTHERCHTAEKPYACGSCDYKCTNWPNLQKHSLRIHSIDLRTKKDSNAQIA